MDENHDGVVTLGEFMDACHNNPNISTGITALDSVF